MMHRALEVPEILLIIFNSITDHSGNPFCPALAALARTCRAFQHPAEEVLWSTLVGITPLYQLLPAEVRKKQKQIWSLTRRTLSGSNWSRFMECASHVRVITEDSPWVCADREGATVIFPAIARQQYPMLLTPNLRKLKWAAPFRVHSAIHLFLGPSLLSLEFGVERFINRVIPLPSLRDTCPKLKHIKITGNGREIAPDIFNAIRGLRFLETVSCSTLNDDALLELASLPALRHLEFDMRWSEIHLDAIQHRFPSDSFRNLQTLRWKDYRLTTLMEIFLLPDILPTNLHLEIEWFCTTESLRAFLQSLAARFPRIQHFSLVHDIRAGRRFGLQAATPGRDNVLDNNVLEPLIVLKDLRGLTIENLGRLQPDDALMKKIACAWPALEELTLESASVEISAVTFDGLVSLLEHCPNLRRLGLRINTENALSFSGTEVRHLKLKHLRLESPVPAVQIAEVDELLLRVLPGLVSVEITNGLSTRVRYFADGGDESSYPVD
ncbi:hypothetical protein HYDPIDRAFT_23691 [Hydnomerulius pinastri MD-312]|nr:hypothetical protein HYDPIDRAFT_23691 [Hydnomerulius pinastri MD-312]